MSSIYPLYDGDSRQQQVTIPWHDDTKGRLQSGNQRILKTNELWSPFTFSEPRGYAQEILIRTMLHRAYRLSSSWESVVRECDYLKGMFFKLGYPDRLVDATVTSFLNSVFVEKDQVQKNNAMSEGNIDIVVVILPFKDQRSADFTR